AWDDLRRVPAACGRLSARRPRFGPRSAGAQHGQLECGLREMDGRQGARPGGMDTAFIDETLANEKEPRRSITDCHGAPPYTPRSRAPYHAAASSASVSRIH